LCGPKRLSQRAMFSSYYYKSKYENDPKNIFYRSLQKFLGLENFLRVPTLGNIAEFAFLPFCTEITFLTKRLKMTQNVSRMPLRGFYAPETCSLTNFGPWEFPFRFSIGAIFQNISAPEDCTFGSIFTLLRLSSKSGNMYISAQNLFWA
jgi:hypothetical protein